MSEKTSPGAQLKYGVELVCKTWCFPRSSFYHHKRVKKKSQRGKRPSVEDERLLQEIQEVIDRSPFSGEGHRKIHAQIKRKGEIPCGRNRVLKLMKINKLLSPYRGRQHNKRVRNGRITTDLPNEMWGTDAAKIYTLEDGWVWFFGVLEHWNAECLGWHLTKQGNRFSAIEALTQAVESVFGETKSMVAQGVHLRVDHGSQFLSEGFVNQARYWGIVISKGFVREPETNGVIERFHRTFKEQVVHGRHYHSLEDLRKTTDTFICDYNERWLLEKLQYHSPLEAKKLYTQGKNVLKQRGESAREQRRRPERALA
jgi:putative transposase